MIKTENCQLKQLLYKTITKLKNYKIKNYNLEVEILMSFVLKKSREFILTHSEYELVYYQKKKLEKIIKERLNNKPIAYIIGKKEFYKLDFYVNKNVLIPRPETEIMVYEALNIIKVFKNKNIKTNIIDIGTGSGAIIIAIAKNALNNNFFATDISRKALNVALKTIKNTNFIKK
ncbi:HemK family protein methyltransferase [bacterium]|nr:HemK family protein methyltransferase [bacterium]